MTADLCLPLPAGGVLRVPLTLGLVAQLEDAHGSVFSMAENILQKTLPLSEAIAILAGIYRAGGCTMTDDARAEFLLADAAPVAVLTGILTRIITPLHHLDAVEDVATGEG